jgi:hypothetical protein
VSRGLVALAIAIAVRGAHAAPPSPSPSAPPSPSPSPAELGWPAATTAVRVIRTSHVRAAPAADAAVLGKIVAGTRAAWTALVAGDRRCPAWVAIAPAGYLCADAVAPTTEAPAGVATSRRWRRARCCRARTSTSRSTTRRRTAARRRSSATIRRRCCRRT